MASKKRKKQRNRQRQTFVAASPPPVSDAQSAGSPAGSAPAAPVFSGPTAPRYGSGISGSRRPAAAATAGIIDIDARVPYFTSDLRRVLITAAAMICLIVVGSLLIH